MRKREERNPIAINMDLTQKVKRYQPISSPASLHYVLFHFLFFCFFVFWVRRFIIRKMLDNPF